ncbi:MAG: response regulator [Clostridia bacterium]|nr:response regulator [Clostridia bacterium]
MVRETDNQEMVLKWLEYDTDVSDLVVMVIQSLPERYENMVSAAWREDVEGFEGLVHSLKGTSGNFHMDEIYQLALAMDDDLKVRWCIDDQAFLFMEHLHQVMESIPEEYYAMEVLGESLNDDLEPFKVLIADPSNDQGKHIRQMLLGQPIQVAYAESEAEIFTRMQADQYDVLILDVQSPLLDGEHILHKLKREKEKRKMYVLILTTDATHEKIEHYRMIGADEQLSKPVDKDAMRQAIVKQMKMREMSV